jgi:LysM repeat protein
MSSLSSSSSSYKKIDNLINGTDDLEKSSFIIKQQQQKPAKKTNYGSLRTDIQQTQTAKVFIINYKHRITKGETLQGISLKYNIPVSRKQKEENFIDFN